MSKGKVRMTAFTRFIIFLLVAGPLSYLVASYYNGENGIENLTDIFNKGKAKVSSTIPSTTPKSSDEVFSKQDLQKQIDRLQKENQVLKERVQRLEMQLQN